MQVAWYLVKVWSLTSPDGQERVIATRPTHSYTWEMWTLDKRDGTTTQIPQRIRRKYPIHVNIAYDKEYEEGNEATFPTRALMRVEYADGEQPPIEAVDYEYFLDTQSKWNALATNYPTLLYRFPDQPYYPST